MLQFAGMKLARLSADDVAAYVSHQRKQSRSHSLSDLSYAALAASSAAASSARVVEVDDDEEAASGAVCLVLALYRDNAVAHLRSMVEEARDVAEGSVTAAALASPFGRSGASSTSVVRSWGLCVDSTDGVL